MSLKLGTTTISGISRETKLNAHSLLDFKWADHILNEMSWLRADTFSWQSGDVYTSVYNLLLAEYQNGTEETEGDITFKRSTNGFKIATSSYENAISNKYNTDGIAWYYILDTTNKRFKLPRTKFGFTGLRDGVGNYVAESLPNITGSFSVRAGVDTDTSQWTGGFYYKGRGITTPAVSQTENLQDVSIGFDASCSSSTYQDNAPVQERATQMYLYFYVGEFSQTATEQTAGLNSEMLNDKVDKADLTTCHVVVKTYVNGTSGYRIWSDGYCEQWGVIGFSATSGWVSGTVSLPKTYANTSYCLLGRGNWSAAECSDFRVNSMNVDSFNVTVAINTMTGHNGQWYTCGYLA